MNKSGILSILVLLVLGYLFYNKFYAQPKEAAQSAKSMLFQMAAKKEWIGFGVIPEIDST